MSRDEILAALRPATLSLWWKNLAKRWERFHHHRDMANEHRTGLDPDLYPEAVIQRFRREARELEDEAERFRLLAIEQSAGLWDAYSALAAVAPELRTHFPLRDADPREIDPVAAAKGICAVVDALLAKDRALPVAASANNAPLALLRVFTNGIADERIGKAAQLLSNDNLTVDEKLTKIHSLIPFPPTASAKQLGDMLGVTKTAVLKTKWWEDNRKGERENLIGRRHEIHRERAKRYEAPGYDDEE